MPETRMTLDIAPRAIVKILVAVVLVWGLCAQPLAAAHVDRRVGRAGDCARSIRGLVVPARCPASIASPVIVVILAAIAVGFFIESGSELAGQAKVLGESAFRGRTGGTSTHAGGDSNAIRAAGKSRHRMRPWWPATC